MEDVRWLEMRRHMRDRNGTSVGFPSDCHGGERGHPPDKQLNAVNQPNNRQCRGEAGDGWKGDAFYLQRSRSHCPRYYFKKGKLYSHEWLEFSSVTTLLGQA